MSYLIFFIGLNLLYISIYSDRGRRFWKYVGRIFSEILDSF